MKELIGVAVLIVGLFEGTTMLREIHDTVRKAALEKAAQGMPSLTEMNRALRHSVPKHKSDEGRLPKGSFRTHG